MESENDIFSRSLPPLVEGKIHGYLRLVIDEVVWSRRSPGDVAVLASWWGERDSAQFRPADIQSGVNRLEPEIAETYIIRTNEELFKEYLINCETVELVIISEKSHELVGTARVSDLLNLLNGKSYFRYIPILNDNGSRIGDIHVTMKLSSVPKTQKQSPSKSELLKKKRQVFSKILPDDTNRCQNSYRSDIDEFTKATLLHENENDFQKALKNAKQSENSYRSILMEQKFDPSKKKFRSCYGVNDKLVAQVVARAQRLRGAILRETRDEELLALSEGSTIESYHSDADNEATLYEYFLGKKMSLWEERKAIKALRTTSPTPSLIDLAAETIRTCRNEKTSQPSLERNQLTKSSKTIDDLSLPETASLRQPKKHAPIDYVDSLRIAVESLTLSSAGFRRVQSSCLSRGDGLPISVTYFVQYDAMFGNLKKFNRKIINESKPVKLSSQKQVGQIIYFNHSAVYDLPKNYLQMDMPLKFKIFTRHLNQRTPTELGIGSMYVGDAARSNSLSSTQRLAIVNKGIKIGELKVTVELGCDKIHFGKQFVEAVTSAKENIPVLDVSSTSSLETEKYRRTTGSDNKSNGKTSTICNRTENSGSVNNYGREMDDGERARRRQQCMNELFVDVEEPVRDSKVLLQGLIYIAEGKDLKFPSTYLICRAFWREDRAASSHCEQTTNPAYHFHQVTPLVHGQQLLERIRDNFIVIEVYARDSNGFDTLLGISKLPVHPLYVAYRDPEVLPHLLRSKFPVICIDGWVSIADPVTIRPTGQIRALVAVGTPEQIALLETSRGIRDSGTMRRSITTFARSAVGLPRLQEDEANFAIPQNAQPRENFEDSQQLYGRTNEQVADNRNFHFGSERTEDNRKTQECQTEISTVNYYKPRVEENLTTPPMGENSQLYAIVDRLAQALTAQKSSSDRAAQTEMESRTSETNLKDKAREIEPLNLNPSVNNSFSGDSSDSSQADRFNLSTEIYRSVGVGAEFDDPANQGPSTSYAIADSLGCSESDEKLPDINLPMTRKATQQDSNAEFDDRREDAVLSAIMSRSTANDRMDSEPVGSEDSSFRARVEVECALHLPKVDGLVESLPPCTYVTFQRARTKNDTQYDTYIVTNVCPYSCSPKWNWKCDTKLPSDLLLNVSKRLILKVWRIADPEKSMKIDLDQDIVIGFSAVDVSVLNIGFPVVSGWFHIMDLTGKCNGQIKVSVTPLDNIIALDKRTYASTSVGPRHRDFEYSNYSSTYPVDLQNTPAANLPNSARCNAEEKAPSHSQGDSTPKLDIGLNLDTVSKALLAKTFSELDVINQRLKSRLNGVTNSAFIDDDIDFDAPIPDDELDEYYNTPNDNSENINNANTASKQNWHPWEIGPIAPGTSPSSDRLAASLCRVEEMENRLGTSNSASLDANYTDTGYSTSSNVPSTGNPPNGNRFASESEDNRFPSGLLSEVNRNGFKNGPGIADGSANILNGHYASYQRSSTIRTEILNGQTAILENDRSNESGDKPVQGSRVHIGYLLDRLSTQVSNPDPPATNQPMKRNIMQLLSSIRRNNNNFPNDGKCNQEANVRTVPTQTETNYVRDSLALHLSERLNARSDDQSRLDDTEIPAKTKKPNKVSAAIREELAADEINESHDCDELSAHLMTTNVRHMNRDNSVNPLLYPHLIPDVQIAPNGETPVIVQNFTNPQSRTPEVEAIERLDTRYTDNFNATINTGLGRLRNLMDVESTSRNVSTSPTLNSENDAIFRVTPSGVSENIDGNIDVTVIHKPCNDELMASNSLDSTTTISLDNDMQTGTEIDDNSSLNSSETSVSAVSRQAPDGGNPVEESSNLQIVKSSDDSQDSSSEN